jgi:hypothetical protein
LLTHITFLYSTCTAKHKFINTWVLQLPSSHLILYPCTPDLSCFIIIHMKWNNHIKTVQFNESSQIYSLKICLRVKKSNIYIDPERFLMCLCAQVLPSP